MTTINLDVDPDHIDQLFDMIGDADGPGACVGIAVGGRPVYRKGFGLADFAAAEALTPATRMRVGSITKQITCLGLMLLCDRGLISPDDPVGDVLPGLPEAMRAATFRQLMTHSAGIRDTHDVAWQFSRWAGELETELVYASNMAFSGRNAPPDATWIYNNGGYLILSKAIEAISGMPFADYLAEAVFAPLGMADTLIRPSDSGFLPRSAALHMTVDQSMFDGRRLEEKADRRFERGRTGIAWSGEAGLVTTIDDMLTWSRNIDERVLGSAECWTQMLTPRKLANGSCSGYALGLFSGHYRGWEVLYHSGGVNGGNAHLVKVPAAALDVIVISNRQDFYGVLAANRILDLLLPADGAIAPRPGVFSPGLYWSPATQRVVELTGSAEEPGAVIDGFDIPMTWRGDGSLAPTGIFGHLRQYIGFEPSSGGASIILSDFGNLDHLVEARFDAGACDPAGRYHAPDIAVTLTIERDGEDWTMASAGRFGTAGFRLTHLAGPIWRARGTTPGYSWAGGILTFNADGGGFGFTSARTRHVRFERQV